MIRTVNSQPVTDLDEFSKLYKQTVEKKDKAVLLHSSAAAAGSRQC